MKYNCCQQSGLCPKNKTCKPLNSREQPWKRFTCACPDGYHGDNCEKRMTSCQGYLDVARKPGKYKVLDSAGSVYEVYCHFDSDVAWTLVQSYSFANKTLEQFKKPLSEDLPFSENAVTWSGYRLRKERMRSIQENATLLRFTCDFEKHHDVEKSDYVLVALDSHSSKIDILTLNNGTPRIDVLRGNIRNQSLNGCKIKLQQSNKPSQPQTLHVRVPDSPHECKLLNNTCSQDKGNYRRYRFFGNLASKCVDNEHRCASSDAATTQLWFGYKTQ